MPDHTDLSGPPLPGSAGPGGLGCLLAPALDPLFARPSRLGQDSAWYGHLPFAGWLVRTLRPATLVELGTHAGVSYAGFCDEVARSGLATRCFAIDGWTGDEHAGFYGEEVLAGLRAFHDQRYGAFSRLLQLRFDEALQCFADGEIDLLHIDGRHFHDDVLHDYRAWLPKLSPGGIVLFHDTNVRERDFGVWRVWEALRREHPGFEFLHGHGLGVLAPGGQPPAALSDLFALGDDPGAGSRLRDRFALLGERWQADYLLVVQERERERLATLADAARSDHAALEAARRTQAGLEAELSAARAQWHALSAAHDRLRDELAFSKADRHRLAETLASQARDRQRQEEERARADARAAILAESLAGAVATTREETAQALSQAQAAAEAARAAASAALAEADRAIAQRAAARAETERLRAQKHQAEQAFLSSTSWRITAPLRLLRGGAGHPTHPAHPGTEPGAEPGRDPAPIPVLVELDPPPATAPAGAVAAELPTPAPPAPDSSPAAIDPVAPPPQASAIAATGWRPIGRILFVAGEPGTPGASYRTARNAAACVAAGYVADCVDIVDVAPDNLAAADLVVLWRAGFSLHIQTMLGLAKAARTRVAFDIDDLIVQPALASAEIIDGIRTSFVTEAESRSYFQSMQRTLTNCDLAIVTTEELAAPVGAQHPVVHVIPNSFDRATERAARRAVRLRAECADDGLVRFGYAGGTRTHQKDFATIVPPLARLLEQRQQARLVLFRDPRSGEGLVLIDEFPELLPWADRIEWRDMVPLADLPGELARFDVSLCPLERDNPFCEAKSELKYFESALAGVCLVATPTGPFRRAIQDGVTGCLPETPEAWESTLLRLADDPSLRRRLARSAYHDSLWQFGPRRQAELWALLLRGLDGGPQGARAAELGLHRGAYRAAGLPEIPDGVVLYSYDQLGEAQVTVGMTSFNYEAYLGEALDSVLAQSLTSIDLVVVDDGSSDGSVALLLDWAERHRTRFNRIRILRTEQNAGLGGARNLMVDQAETPWIMVLDSDNRLAPEACARLLAAVEEDGLAAFAYPTIRQFGAADDAMGVHGFDPRRLSSGNYIDAMALVAKWAWAAAGGYYVRRDAMGWEDFSLWCRLVERGLHGVAVAEELAFYRVHARSMVNVITEQDENKRAMVSFVERRHGWLRLRMRASRQRR